MTSDVKFPCWLYYTLGQKSTAMIVHGSPSDRWLRPTEPFMMSSDIIAMKDIRFELKQATRTLC